MNNRMENETAVIGECVRVMGEIDENGLIDIKPCVPRIKKESIYPLIGSTHNAHPKMKTSQAIYSNRWQLRNAETLLIP